MASIPHFCSDYQFTPDEFSEIVSVMAQENYAGTFSTGTNSTGVISSGAMLADNNNFPMLFDNVGFDIIPTESEAMSPVPGTSFPERLGISDMAVSTLLDSGLRGIANIQNFGGGFQLSSDACDYRDDCCGFVPNFQPACPAAGENWGIQFNRMPAIEHTNIKVGQYTVEERKDRILRYVKKRNQRNFNKTIKYACRKTLADRRVRIRGRFARNNELCEEEEGEVKKNGNLHHQEKKSCCSDVVETKNDEDEWLQEAMASLMYVPYIAG